MWNGKKDRADFFIYSMTGALDSNGFFLKSCKFGKVTDMLKNSDEVEK